MEHKRPHEIANQLLEARLALSASANLGLETILIERVAELPEDDFCHFARETFFMGAGYAYQERESLDISAEDILKCFFLTQPQNRYLDYETVDLERKAISQAALELLETRHMPELENPIDPYMVEAAAAFTEGFMIVASLSPCQSIEADVA